MSSVLLNEREGKEKLRSTTKRILRGLEPTLGSGLVPLLVQPGSSPSPIGPGRHTGLSEPNPFHGSNPIPNIELHGEAWSPREGKTHVGASHSNESRGSRTHPELGNLLP